MPQPQARSIDFKCGCVAQVRLLMEMLNLDPWCMFPLKLQLLSSAFNPLRAGCPDLPPHMQVLIAPLEVCPPSPKPLRAPVYRKLSSDPQSTAEHEQQVGGSVPSLSPCPLTLLGLCVSVRA